ncbi:hypothetical protein P886_0198 [Alteromonadaceae bacterium 2753L.S.0a.02]|nr:hypothetical protein P886_0198 [Alteromonadaceae bacterium 2753L.S.0a.02]
MEKFIFIGVLMASMSSSATPWAGPAEVKYVRTYDGEAISIGLKGVECQNAKDYFLVQGLAKNESFLSIALAAYMGGKKLQISYDATRDSTHCYVNGIWIQD